MAATKKPKAPDETTETTENAAAGADTTAPPGVTNLPGVRQRKPEPPPRLDFKADDDDPVEVKAARNIPLSMLKTLGAPVPPDKVRGRIERGTRIVLGEEAALWMYKRGYVTQPEEVDEL